MTYSSKLFDITGRLTLYVPFTWILSERLRVKRNDVLTSIVIVFVSHVTSFIPNVPPHLYVLSQVQ